MNEVHLDGCIDKTNEDTVEGCQQKEEAIREERSKMGTDERERIGRKRESTDKRRGILKQSRESK